MILKQLFIVPSGLILLELYDQYMLATRLVYSNL